MLKLNARELRTQEPDEEAIKNLKKNPIYIILDNVLDTYNVGAIFRLADAVAAEKVYLCGQTETPPNPKIKKASINTWRWVDWIYCSSTLEAIEQCNLAAQAGNLTTRLQTPERSDGGQVKQCKIIAIEQNKKSIPLSRFTPEFPLALVVGNETYGVSEEVLKAADAIVELPMYGINKSLNVMVCCGIVLYKILEDLY